MLSVLIQAPQTNWVRVIENLDHEGFFLPSEEAFSFLMAVYKHACKVYIITLFMPFLVLYW